MNQELAKINRWLKDDKFKFNHSENNFIIFSHRNNLKLPGLTLGNEAIVQSDSANFLGVIIDGNLNFNLQINQISSKISNSVGILYGLNEFFPEQQLKILHNSLVVPHISNAIEAWYGVSRSSSSSRIFVLQKKAVRNIFSLSFNSHNNDKFKSGRTLKVDDIYNLTIGAKIFSLLKSGTNTLWFPCHGYQLRHRNNGITPLMRRSKFQKYRKHRGIKLWNSLSMDIRRVNTERKFKILLKDLVLSKYWTTINPYSIIHLTCILFISISPHTACVST